MLNAISHQFRGHDCFFGYRNVAGSRGHDYDHTLAVLLAVTLENDGSSQGTILCEVYIVGQYGGDGGVLFLGGSRRQHVAAVGGEAAEDGGDLAGRFALGKNHLGHTLAHGTMMVDLGETEVLKGQVTQALDGIVGREAFLSNLLEQLA